MTLNEQEVNPLQCLLWTMLTELLLLTDAERAVLQSALDLYIGLGLGRLSDVGKKLPLLWHSRSDAPQDRIACILAELEGEVLAGRTWSLRDHECDLHPLIAHAILCRLRGDYEGWRRAARRVRRLRRKRDA